LLQLLAVSYRVVMLHFEYKELDIVIDRLTFAARPARAGYVGGLGVPSARTNCRSGRTTVSGQSVRLH